MPRHLGASAPAPPARIYLRSPPECRRWCGELLTQATLAGRCASSKCCSSQPPPLPQTSSGQAVCPKFAAASFSACAAQTETETGPAPCSHALAAGDCSGTPVPRHGDGQHAPILTSSCPPYDLLSPRLHGPSDPASNIRIQLPRPFATPRVHRVQRSRHQRMPGASEPGWRA